MKVDVLYEILDKVYWIKITITVFIAWYIITGGKSIISVIKYWRDREGK